MRILVTGSAGFLGGHLCKTLKAAGHEITGLDLRSGNHGHHHIVGDVCDAGLVQHLVANADAVVHLACVVGYAHVMAGIEQAVYTTSVGTAHIVRACLTNNTPLLFTSTSAVYGHGQRTENGGAREDDHLKLGPTTTPSWAYAYAKAAAECQVLAAHREHALPATVVRLFNVVGPGQSAQAGFVLPRFVRSALAGETLTVYAPGSQTRTFVHVDDIAVALHRCLETPRVNGEVLNLGGTITVSITTLAERVNDVLSNSAGMRIVPPPYVGYEEIRERRPDLSKAKRLLGYAPTYSLDTMIRDTAEALAPEVLV